jgi:anti-sigma-K factor RskA
MIDEQTQDLVLQYLLGELEPSQTEAVRTRIESDAELKNFVIEMEETVGSIAYSVQPITAPADIPQRILRAERGPVRPVPEAPRSRIAAFGIIPWALAACLAIACIILGLDRERVRNGLSKELAALQETNAQTSKALTQLEQKSADSEKEIAAFRERSAGLEKQLAALEQKNAEAQTELAALKQSAAEQEHALAELRRRDADAQKELTELKEKDRLAQIKIATLKAQVAAFQQTNAIVVWDPDQRRGVLQLEKLPPPAHGKDYQLWVIDSKKPQPVSAGVLSVPNNGLIRTSFQPTAPVESAAAFAISVEKRGGSMKPEGQIILVGK